MMNPSLIMMQEQSDPYYHFQQEKAWHWQSESTYKSQMEMKWDQNHGNDVMLQ